MNRNNMSEWIHDFYRKLGALNVINKKGSFLMSTSKAFFLEGFTC